MARGHGARHLCVAAGFESEGKRRHFVVLLNRLSFFVELGTELLPVLQSETRGGDDGGAHLFSTLWAYLISRIVRPIR